MCQGLWNIGIINQFNFLPSIYLLQGFISKGTNKREKENCIRPTVERTVDARLELGFRCQHAYAECSTCWLTIYFPRLLDGKLICVVIFDT